MAYFQTDHLWIHHFSEGMAILYLDVADRSVNLLSAQVLADLDQAIAKIEQDKNIRLLIIRSSKENHFIAGADINEFATIDTSDAAISFSKLGQNVFQRLENLAIPSVALISGACLGGGLELALACDYRYAVRHAKTVLGLPELELGLIPGWGGTQRLPRVIGLKSALQMILARKRVHADDARRIGLVDEILPSEDADLTNFLKQSLRKRPKKNPHASGWLSRLLEWTSTGRKLIYRGTERILRKRVADDMPAPQMALQVVRIGVEKGMAAGLEAERKANGELAVSQACRNLVSIFLNREKARKVPPVRPNDDPPIRNVGVVGVGVMGAGIAQLAALKKCDVVLQEVEESALGMGIFRILALFKKAMGVGLVTQGEIEKKLAAIHGTTSWKGFADLDLVIESVPENLKTKRKVFAELEKHCSPSTILTTNTSSLSVATIQEEVSHSERLAGLHFFHPVHAMPLVEVVATEKTKKPVINNLLRFVVHLGKIPVVVKDSPGFLVNRLLAPYLNEAMSLIGEGLSIQTVDRAMTKFGMLAGPLETLDQIGIDVAALVTDSIEEVFEGRLLPHPGFAQMVREKWLGQKTGRGFYIWHGSKKKTNSQAEALIRHLASGNGSKELPAMSDDHAMTLARDRMLLVTINEAMACLSEQIVSDADTLDLAMILGTGWAPHQGGPMTYARNRGLFEIMQKMSDFSESYGSRFQPHPELKRLASIS